MSSAPIVVPVDGSRNAENALPHAVKLASYLDAPIHLVHIVESSAGQKGLAEARKAFQPYAEKLSERYHMPAAELHVGQGSPANEILKYAGGEAAQMTVIASHGRGGFRAALVGSVADKVVRGAEIATLVVPGVNQVTEATYDEILVGVDGSPEAERALAKARELAQATGGHITLVRAYTSTPPVGIEFGYYPGSVADALREAADEYLSETAQENEGTLLMVGSASAAVEEGANHIDADLIVLASRGKGLAARIALGSTTDRVMHSTHRPLLVVPALD